MAFSRSPRPTHLDEECLPRRDVERWRRRGGRQEREHVPHAHVMGQRQRRARISGMTIDSVWS